MGQRLDSATVSFLLPCRFFLQSKKPSTQQKMPISQRPALSLLQFCTKKKKTLRDKRVSAAMRLQCTYGHSFAQRIQKQKKNARRGKGLRGKSQGQFVSVLVASTRQLFPLCWHKRKKQKEKDTPRTTTQTNPHAEW